MALRYHCFCSGLEFYCKLDENVSRLLSRVNGVVKVQEEERQQLTQSTTKKAAEARYLVQSSLLIWILILNFNAKNFFRKAAEARYLVQSSVRDLDPDPNF